MSSPADRPFPGVPFGVRQLLWERMEWLKSQDETRARYGSTPNITFFLFFCFRYQKNAAAHVSRAVGGAYSLALLERCAYNLARRDKRQSALSVC